jgi:hypothetical protein
MFYVALHGIVIQCFGVHCYVNQALFLHFISHAFNFCPFANSYNKQLKVWGFSFHLLLFFSLFCFKILDFDFVKSSLLLLL